MKLSDLTYISSRSVMVHVHGKEYPVRKHKDKERYYIQHAKGQLTVTPLIKSFEFKAGTWADYVFNGWFQIYDFDTYKLYAAAELSWLKNSV